MRHVLVFVLLMIFCQAYGQDAATTGPAQNVIQVKEEAVLEGAGSAGKIGKKAEGIRLKVKAETGKIRAHLKFTHLLWDLPIGTRNPWHRPGN